MTHTKDEALDLALEALTNNAPGFRPDIDIAITAIKQARSAPVQPVAIVAEVHMSRYTLEWTSGPLPEGTELFDRPAAQPTVPEGMKLVPVEPTQGMVKAFQDAMSLEFGMRTTAGYHARVYSAMLAAAPEKGQP